MNHPTIYVIAGPNGIGKTTSDFDIIPDTTPIINSDEIAAEVKRTGLITGNTQEYANREALRVVDDYLTKRTSFGIESNLCDLDTWKFLLNIQDTGYRLYVIYISTENLDTLNTRINNRVKEGGHYIRPDIVEERYYSGLKLLNHYFDRPDRLVIFDNSKIMSFEIEMMKGEAFSPIRRESLPAWITQFLPNVIERTPSTPTKHRDLNSIDEVRRKYKEEWLLDQAKRAARANEANNGSNQSSDKGLDQGLHR